MAEIELIRAGEEHVSLLCALFCKLHRTHTDLRPDFFAPITNTTPFETQIRDLLRTKQRIFLLARKEGEICGYLEGRLAEVDPDDVLYTPRRFAKIENLYILPEFRRRGVARALAEAFIDYAALRGFSSVELQVLGANEAALAFYRSMGFGVQQHTLEKQIKR